MIVSPLRMHSHLTRREVSFAGKQQVNIPVDAGTRVPSRIRHRSGSNLHSQLIIRPWAQISSEIRIESGIPIGVSCHHLTVQIDQRISVYSFKIHENGLLFPILRCIKQFQICISSAVPKSSICAVRTHRIGFFLNHGIMRKCNISGAPRHGPDQCKCMFLFPELPAFIPQNFLHSVSSRLLYSV